MRKTLTLAAITVIGYSSSLQAQSVEEVKTRFPGHEAVAVNNSMSYKIKLVNSEPQVESKDLEQILYLSNNAATYMSRYGFTHSSFHQLQEYEAYTHTSDKKKIAVKDFKTTNSKTSGIFYDDVKETMFDFPAIGPGAVGTLELNLKHKDAHLLSPFYFSRKIPVLKSELKISFPKDFQVKYIIRGDDKKQIQFTQDTRRNEIVYTFTANNVASSNAYSDAPAAAYYTPHVIFYIEGYKNEKGESISYLRDLNDLYRLNYSFIAGINKEIRPELKQLVDSLTGTAKSKEEKAKKIYRWVQNNIKYVAFEEGMEGFIPRDANLVCNRRFGDCKDMASILTVMLNAAGVPAYYTWIGTRHIPYRYTEVPTPIVDNHMICTINLDGKFIFLDGTDPTCIFGIPSGGIQGKEAFLSMNEKEYKILEVPVIAKKINTLSDTTYLNLTESGINGKIAIDLGGYFAMDMFGFFLYTSEKEREKELKSTFNRGSNKFKLENFEVKEDKELGIVKLAGNFSLQDYARKIGDEWFINMNLKKFFEHQEIDIPKREMPIEFPFLSSKKYVTVLNVPSGYKVSYLPKGKNYQNDVWGFRMSYEQKGNQVILTQEFDNDHMLMTKEKFADWNKVLENLYPLYKETISLTKN